jgi:hypothetical protein
MNNRKSTLGRPVRHIPIEKIIGFTVKVAHGTWGYKNKQHVKEFIPIEDQKEKIKTLSSKLPTRKYQRAKRDLWLDAIIEAEKNAEKRAEKLSENGEYLFLVFPKIVKTSFREIITK